MIDSAARHSMPIEFFESPEGRRVGQSFASPTVYLDHWAIRLFSDNLALQDRLVAALLQKRGRLLISSFSMAEMAGASDPQHVIDAERLLERCLPQLFLTDFRLDEVLPASGTSPAMRRGSGRLRIFRS
jgi:hypothetical protein